MRKSESSGGLFPRVEHGSDEESDVVYPNLSTPMQDKGLGMLPASAEPVHRMKS